MSSTSTTPARVSHFDRALEGQDVWVRHADGWCCVLETAGWFGPARGGDLGLLDRVAGPVLDIGCGPGRLVAGLTDRRVPALGIDVALTAVRLTRARGGSALQRSVFAALPGEGRWGGALLADGNVGIGGDPVRLLSRVGSLLRPGGSVALELSGSGVTSSAVRLETCGERPGEWFCWSTVGVDAVGPVCRAAGLQLVRTWSAWDETRGCRRSFAVAVQP